MSTDSQGRPLSDDGQWAWNGTEWVPAAGGQAPAAAEGAAPVEDVGATMIAPSPFAGGFPGAAGTPGAPGAPGAPGGPPAAGYGAAQPGYGAAQPGYGQAQGYGQPPAGGAPGYGAGLPGGPSGFGNPSQSKSRKPVIWIIVGLVVIAAAVVAIVLATSSSSKKAGPTGAFKCTAPGTSGTGTITFSSGNHYALSDQGNGGTFTQSGNTLTFVSGDLKNDKATFDSSANTVKITVASVTLNCTR